MKFHVVTVFLSLVLHLHGAVLASEIRYTLITANSPDCNSSLADYYPVSVLGDFNSTGEWTELNPQLGESRVTFFWHAVLTPHWNCMDKTYSYLQSHDFACILAHTIIQIVNVA